MVVSLNSNALLTLEELDIFLQTTIGDADYSNTLINFASDFIEKYCNRIFNDATYTREVYDGNDEKELYLNNFPINSVSAVEEWDTYNDVLLYTFTEHLEYMVYLAEGYIYMRSKWIKGNRNYRITYNAGYTTIPSDVKKACSDLCSWFMNNKDKMGINSEKIGSYSYSMGSARGSEFRISGLDVPSEILSLLANYRIINI